MTKAKYKTDEERRAISSAVNRKHGHTIGKDSPTYRSWCGMIGRCHNSNHSSYSQYGAIGITVSTRWRSFEQFLADMGERPSVMHSIDRIDGKKGYEPANCRWATRREQRLNQARTRSVIRSDGLRFRSIVEAAEATGGTKDGIRDTCIRRQNSHRGYQWDYVDALSSS